MPRARSEEQAKASGEGAGRVKNEVKKQKMEEQGGTHETWSGSLWRGFHIWPQTLQGGQKILQ